jgi:hypothetical protein
MRQTAGAKLARIRSFRTTATPVINSAAKVFLFSIGQNNFVTPQFGIGVTPKFALPYRRAFIESSLPLGRAINLNHLQRLNRAHPEHSFQLWIARRLLPVSVDADE